MAIGGYLPPLVTALEGNVRPLADAFAEGETMAEAYSEKMDGTLTNGMQDAGQHSAEAFDKEVKSGMDKTWRDANGRLRDERGKFVREGEALGDSLMNGVENAVNGGGGGGRSGRTGRRAAQGFVSQFIEGASAIGSNIVPILIGAAIVAAPAIAAAIGAAIAIVLPLAFAGIGVAIAAAMLPKVQKAFQSLANPIRSAFRYAISGAFDDALLGAIKEFGKYIPQFRGPLRAVFDAVAPILKPLADSLGKSITAFLTALATTLTQSQPVIIEFLNRLPDLVKSFGDFLISATENGPALVRFLDDSLNFLEKFITDSGKVISWLTSVYDWIVKLNDASPIEFLGFSRKLEGAKIAWQGWLDWMNASYDKAISILQDTWYGWLGWMNASYDTAIAWTRKALSAIGHWFKKLGTDIVDDFKGSGTWLINAGENLVKGLIKGVGNMWKWATGKIGAFGGGILQAFNDALGIASPSRLFMEAGLNVVRGFVLGVLGSQADARAAVSGMLGSGPVWAAPGYALAGAAPAVAGGGAVYHAPMVHTVVQMDSRAVVDAITPSTQRRKSRSGTSGMA